MSLTEEQREAFDKAVKPVIKWLNENSHPHTKVVIDAVSAELLESAVYMETFEYLKGLGR